MDTEEAEMSRCRLRSVLCRTIGLVVLAGLWTCGPDTVPPAAPGHRPPPGQPVLGSPSLLAVAGVGGSYSMPASGDQVPAVPLGPTGLVAPSGMPARVVISGAITRQPTAGLLFFCSTVEWQWACESMWADLVSDAPIPPAGIWGYLARAAASWDGAAPGSMEGDSDLTLRGPAGAEVWAGRSAFVCYYELSVRYPDGTWKYPYDFGPCDTFGGAFVVTVQPDDGGGLLLLAAAPPSLPAGGGDVTFTASAADGSALEAITWHYALDPAPASVPIAAAEERAGGLSLADARAGRDRGDVYTVGPDRRLEKGWPTGGGVLLVRAPAPRAAPARPRPSAGTAGAAPARDPAAATSACDGAATCVQHLTATGTMVVQATVRGRELSAAARVPVGGGGAVTPTVSIVSAQGLKADGSFVAGVGENEVQLVALVEPDSFAPRVVWDVHDDPDDQVATAPPAEAPTGASTTFLVPQQTRDRWTAFAHPGQLIQKSLGYEIRATLTVGGTTIRSDAVKVRQNEIDTMEQEYEDYGVTQPPLEALTRPVQIPYFSWSELNSGDYGYAFLDPGLVTRLPQLRDSIGDAVILNSGFRNPVHHRFHLTRAPGEAVAEQSYHQSGGAVDVSTGDATEWTFVAGAAHNCGFCIEPMVRSGSDHVHADWRGGRNQCPSGW